MQMFPDEVGEEMRSVINISRALDKEKIGIPDIN